MPEREKETPPPPKKDSNKHALGTHTINPETKLLMVWAKGSDKKEAWFPVRFPKPYYEIKAKDKVLYYQLTPSLGGGYLFEQVDKDRLKKNGPDPNKYELIRRKGKFYYIRKPSTEGRPDGDDGSHGGSDSGRATDHDYRFPITHLKGIDQNTPHANFIKNAEEDIDAAIKSWKRYPERPRTTLMKLLEDSSLAHLTPEQKKLLDILIEIRTMKMSDVYRLLDARHEDKLDKKYKDNLESYRQVAHNHLEYLKERDKNFMDLLMGKDEEPPWTQVSEKEALIAIDNIRKSFNRGKRDYVSITKNVADYLYLLTELQRDIFSHKIKALLDNTDQKDLNYGVIESLARGTSEYYKVFYDKKDPAGIADSLEPDEHFSDIFKARIESRDYDALKLYDATHDYITYDKDSEEYIINKEGEEAFLDEVFKFGKDNLISFATGLKGTVYEAYGERLLLALSVADTKGNRVLPTENTDPNHGDGPLGGIYFPSNEQDPNRYSRKTVQDTLQNWNQTDPPRSTHHVWQGLNNIRELIPESGKRRIYYIHDGQLKSFDLDPSTAKDKPIEIGDGRILDFENPQNHSFRDKVEEFDDPRSEVFPLPRDTINIDTRVEDKEPLERKPYESSGRPNISDDQAGFVYDFETVIPKQNSACNGSFIGKHEVSPGKCELPILTAAHCVHEGKRYKDGLFGKEFIKNITIKGKKYVPKTIQRPPDNNYDLAVMVIEGNCSDFPDNEIYTIYDGGLNGAEPLTFRKSHIWGREGMVWEGYPKGSFEPDNAGKLIRGVLAGDPIKACDRFFPTDSVSPRIVPGDSGSPIFYNNQIISILSGYTGKRFGARDFVFPGSTARIWTLAWLKSRYGKFYITDLKKPEEKPEAKPEAKPETKPERDPHNHPSDGDKPEAKPKEDSEEKPADEPEAKPQKTPDKEPD